MNVGLMVLLQILPLALRTTLYVLAFKIRSVHATVVTCIILGGASSLLAMIPLHMPMPVQFGATMGVSMYLMSRLTDADIFPDILLTPFCVEFISAMLLELVLFPLLS
jgi:hypothetical protein